MPLIIFFHFKPFWALMIQKNFFVPKLVLTKPRVLIWYATTIYYIETHFLTIFAMGGAPFEPFWAPIFQKNFLVPILVLTKPRGLIWYVTTIYYIEKMSWKTSSRLRWCNNVLRCLKKVAPNPAHILLSRCGRRYIVFICDKHVNSVIVIKWAQ